MPFTTPTKTNHHDVYDAISPTNPALSVSGKTVLITGAGQGIGKVLALTFSTAGAANLILLGRKLNTLGQTKEAVLAQKANKAKVHTFQADITDESRINTVFSEIVSSVGKIDIYIANAGYLPDASPAATASIQDFKTGFDINVIGQLIVAQAFLKACKPNATIVSINTAASLAYFGPMVGYTASKAASIRVYDAISNENPDVRVFNLHPGVIPSDMSMKAGMHSIANDTPELAAGFALWLSSPKADFLKGRFLWSGWDVEELEAMKGELFSKRADNLTLSLAGEPFEYTTPSPFDP